MRGDSALAQGMRRIETTLRSSPGGSSSETGGPCVTMLQIWGPSMQPHPGYLTTHAIGVYRSL